MGEKGGKKRELDFKVTGYFWLDSLFLEEQAAFSCMSFSGGGSRWSAAGQEITPPRDDAGSCPLCVCKHLPGWSVSESSPAAPTRLCSWRCTLSSTSWRHNPWKNRIHPPEINKVSHYCELMLSLGRNGYLGLRVTWYESNVMQRQRQFCSETSVFHVLIFFFAEGVIMKVRLGCLNIVWCVCAGLNVLAGPHRHLWFHESACLLFLERRKHYKGGTSIKQLRVYNSLLDQWHKWSLSIFFRYQNKKGRKGLHGDVLKLPKL